MIDREQLFFYLLRLGMGLAEEEYEGEIPNRTEWNALWKMAYEQAVTGLLTDGVARTRMRPNEEVWEQWLIHLMMMEQMNREIEACGKQWVEWLHKAGIMAFVFKGASVAEWYPQPLHRSFGDVDVVVMNGWNILKSLLEKEKIAYRMEGDDMVVQQNGKPPVEFHSNWEYVYNPLVNARLKRLCREADENDRELYLVCLILHIRRHFLTYGIGLKQVCDVAVMLRRAELDGKRVADLLKRLHADGFARIVFGFIESYLGGMDDYPLEPVRKGQGAELFKNIVMNDGYRLKMEREEKVAQSGSPIGRIGGNAWFWIRRGRTLLGIMPGEVCGFLINRVVKRL